MVITIETRTGVPMSANFVEYGPDYNSEISAILGCNLRECRMIKQNVYIRPCWRLYRMPDARYAWIVEQTWGDTVRMFDTKSEWEATRVRFDDGMPDPETGRRIS